MDLSPNQAEDQDNKQRKKLPPCKIKRNLVRLMEFNKNKKIEFINNWLTNSYTKPTDNYFTMKLGHIDLQDGNQVILHFINPELSTFPRGFAQIVALSHDVFELEEMKQEEIEIQHNDFLKIYFSTNRYGCGFMHIKSRRENFTEDLDKTLNLLSYLMGTTRKKIVIPAIGMGLWRTDPYAVLKRIKEYEDLIKNIGFEMIINDDSLFRTINKALDELKNETSKNIEKRNEEEKANMDPSREELEEIKKKQNTELIDEPPTAGKHNSKKKKKNWKSWIPRLYKRKAIKNINQDTEDIEMEDTQDQDDRRTENEESQAVVQISIENKKEACFNSNTFYENLNLNYNLAKLEEPLMLTAALRIIVRNLHPSGKTITFPIIEEVDKINLRANGITSDPQDLLTLIDKVFERRNESFHTNNVYRQFVMAYGRIVFIPAEKYPACYVHTRQP